jgi:LysM repeat protein
MLTVILVMMSGGVVTAGPELQHEGAVIHYVAWGESLSAIADRYGVTVEVILRQNGIANPDMIYIGQRLVIPGVAVSSSGPAPGCATYHTVAPGETLSTIAWQYNTTLPALLRANDLYNKDMLYAGQTICLPAGDDYRLEATHGDQPPPPAASSYYHTVSAGETLSGICLRYGVNQWAVVQANNLSNASYIWPGQQLIIPGQTPPPADHHHHEGAMPEPPPHKPQEKVSSYTPPAPTYQSAPISKPLPQADHPLEVVINGGETWVDDIYPLVADPDGTTTLVVQVENENNKAVRIRSGDYEVKGETGLEPAFGAFRFVFRYIPPGDYDVWVDDPDLPSEKAHVQIKAGERTEVFFKKQVFHQGPNFASPDGWYLADWVNPSKPHQNLGGWSNILMRTPASGLYVIIESEGGGYKAKCFTGSKGDGACDFAGLSAGFYFIHIDGTQYTIKTYMDGNAYAEFTLMRQAQADDRNKLGPYIYTTSQ